jgi:hypothetical protein
MIAPHHQFEIRYTTILNFPNIIRTPLAPFIKFAKRINIDNEGSHNEKITLFFDDDYFQIIIAWDRIIFRFEGDKEDLSKNNSIVEEPFFNILSKIRQSDNFGEINNVLFYSFFIHSMEITEEELVKKFIGKYLTNTHKIVDNPSDIGITLDYNVGGKQISVNFGPYLGEEDLKKRNIVLKNPIVTSVAKDAGLCCEFKFFNLTKTVSFAEYKDISKTEKQYIKHVWDLQ